MTTVWSRTLGPHYSALLIPLLKVRDFSGTEMVTLLFHVERLHSESKPKASSFSDLTLSLWLRGEVLQQLFDGLVDVLFLLFRLSLWIQGLGRGAAPH